MTSGVLFRPFRGPVTTSVVEPPLRSVPAAFLLVVIHVLSSIPGSDIALPVNDKVGHFAEYALLGALLLFAVTAFPRGTNRNAAVGALAFAAFYAAIDEWHQSMVPGRVPSAADWVVDVLGAAIAILVIRSLVSWSDPR